MDVEVTVVVAVSVLVTVTVVVDVTVDVTVVEAGSIAIPASEYAVERLCVHG